MELFINGLISVVHPFVLMMISIGVIVGIIFGAIPGLSATMAVALFLPVTYGMEPLTAMSLLVALYVGGVSGGLISAILLKIPGTPSSVATCWDGHPMTEKGQSIKAIGLGTFFSFWGTIVSVVALSFIAPPLAKLAVAFGFYEYCSVAIFSLTMIATLSSGSMVKGIFSGILGIVFSTVGMAPIDATPRFTFGIRSLNAGFDILPVLVGLFAISEILSTAETAFRNSDESVIIPNRKGVKGFGFSFQEFKEQIVNFIRSSLIGIGIGILPGVGGGTSNIIAYTVAKTQSKYPEKFGTGIPDGIVASETANNATIGGAMIPLLTLGIPGDAVTAMLLGGLMLHGLTPGPLLFVKNANVVYGIFAALVVASIVMLIVQYYGIRLFVKVLLVPKHILMPIIFSLCVVGAYGLKSRIFDVGAIAVFGLLGFAFTKCKIPTAPFILGFILGPMAEVNLRRGLQLSQGSFMPFITEPISLVLLIITAVSLTISIIKELKSYRSKKQVTAQP